MKDITLGQYFPGKTAVHRMDPRVKIVLTIAYIVLLFVVKNPLGYAVVFAIFAAVLAISKIPLKVVLKGVKPILFLVVFASILNIFYNQDGRELLHFWIIRVTTGGVQTAAFMSFRMVFLIMGTSLLTYTTSPIMLTDAIERLLKPLKKIRVPVHELAMMMTIALRFIPTLIEETEKIMDAQKARGADFESGNLLHRAKALVPLLVPLFISAFRRADELAIAMESRCYRGDIGRTRMKVLRVGRVDYLSILFIALCYAGVIALNMIG
nr:energy-coupling factor transporter transmembrane component T [Feifania hominis]